MQSVERSDPVARAAGFFDVSRPNHTEIMIRYISVPILVLIAGCITIKYFDLPHQSVETVSSLHGKNIDQVFRRFGKPNDDVTFKLNEPLDTFRKTLHQQYPFENPNSHDVVVRECTWEYWRYSITLWFHKPDAEWAVFQSKRYQIGVKF